MGEYRGRKHVSLREFYCKDGAWLPGKKGINLSVEQWRGLKAAAPRVTARLRSGETSACVVAELGDGRRVTCGAFRGAVTVGVREYYEKNGEMLPGFRGLNMSAQQWDVFAARVEAPSARRGGKMLMLLTEEQAARAAQWEYTETIRSAAEGIASAPDRGLYPRPRSLPRTVFGWGR